MPPVNLIDPATGRTFAVDEADAARLEADGWAREDADAKVARLTQERVREDLGGMAGAVAATVAGGLRTGTAGISDALFSAAGIGDDLRHLRELHGTASLVGEVGGMLLPGGAVSMAGRAGRAVGGVAEGASIGQKLVGAARAGVVEGAILGAGSGVSEVSLSAEPVTLERAISSIGSNALFGGAVGGAAGLLTKGAQIGLGKVRDKLDDVAAGATAQVDDTAKVALRDELAAFRKQVKTDKVWLATKDSGIDGLQSVGKRTLKADKALDNLLDDPKALIDNPKAALRHLRVQESALQDVVNKSDELRAALTKQGSTNRLAALDKVAPALEKNRALQKQIETLVAQPAAAAGGASLGANMLGGQAFGVAASAVGAIPGIGPMLAPLAGAAASKLVTEGLGKMAAKQAARASKAITTFLDVTAKAPPIAPALASKTLATVRYAEGKSKAAPEAKPGKAAPKIAKVFKQRADEIKSQTQYDPAGQPIMRPEARQRLAQRFDGIRHVDPIAADKLETLAAKQLTFLASKLPRKPDVAGLATGPDRWQPSDMMMRAAARYMLAVEDPIGVVERLATGQITPEDAEAMREVYPEMYADIQRQIISQLPTLRQSLPYHRRVALSIFSGIPVDPAMHPRILGVLQRSFAEEAGTEGGNAAPKPQPQFGSVRNQEATPSQERQGATA